MGLHLQEKAFNCTADSGVKFRCNTMVLFQNSMAYTWGIARIGSVVPYVAHVDDDLCLQRENENDWIQVAIGVLQNNAQVLSVTIGGVFCPVVATPDRVCIC